MHLTVVQRRLLLSPCLAGRKRKKITRCHSHQSSPFYNPFAYCKRASTLRVPAVTFMCVAHLCTNKRKEKYDTTAAIIHREHLQTRPLSYCRLRWDNIENLPWRQAGYIRLNLFLNLPSLCFQVEGGGSGSGFYGKLKFLRLSIYDILI